MMKFKVLVKQEQTRNKISRRRPGMVQHIAIPATQEANAGG
jgi:hypothetical protein